MELFVSWAILTVIVLLTAALLPGMKVRGVGGALLVAALFGILNFFIGWLFFGVLGIATLGLGFLFAFLTRLVVDAILLKIVDAMTQRLYIRSFGTAFIAALIMSGLGTLAEMLWRSV